MKKTYKSFNQVQPFLGQYIIESLFYLYLFNKYKTKCLVASTDARENMIPDIKIVIDKTAPKFNHERLRDLAKKLVKCISLNEPIIIFQLSLRIEVEVSGQMEGHANLLIYRNNTRQLEHFEPHGSSFKGFDENTMILVNDVLDKDLDYLVKNMNDELVKKDLLPITLVKAHEVCPRILGVQVYESRSRLKKLPIEPGGYCAAWSMFFAEMCLKNPEIPSKQIYKAILDERDKQSDYNSKFKKLIRGNDYNNYFKKIIRGYTCFINNKMAKYFTEILGFEITSEKLYNYSNNPEEDKIVKDFLYKLNGLINKEVDPDYEIDIRKKDMKDITDYYNTSKKYNTFKKTVRKSTSSSDLSSKEKKSRRHTKQLKEEYDTKLSEFVKKDNEKKATEKKRKEEAERDTQMAMEEDYDDEEEE
jgi:hypothetical protein